MKKFEKEFIDDNANFVNSKLNYHEKELTKITSIHDDYEYHFQRALRYSAILDLVKNNIPHVVNIIKNRPSRYQPIEHINKFIKKLKKGDTFYMRSADYGTTCIFEKAHKSGKYFLLFFRVKRRYENGSTQKINKVISYRINLIRNEI